MLTIKSLTIAYGKRTILENVNLEFKRGTITVIQGESGSGKSSLLNVLGLMQTAYKGEYTFDNTVVSNYGDAERANFRLNSIGFVFQQSNLIQELTARDNLIVPMSITNHGKDIYEKADELLRYVGLEDVKDSYPESMSGGEEQRLALARAIANDADIILADEPTAALDKKNATKVLELLSKLSHELNKIVIVVSHDDFVSEYADAIYEIKDKTLVATKVNRENKSTELSKATNSPSKTLNERNVIRFVRYYTKRRRGDKNLNRIFVALTAFVAALAILSANLGANFMASQEKFVNSISDRSIFVVNDTLGRNTPVNYENAFAISKENIEKIESISGVSKVYPWYIFTSNGWDYYTSPSPTANIKITDGATVLVDQVYHNPFSGTSTLIDKAFAILPLYEEENISHLLESKWNSDENVSSGLVLTKMLAEQLSTNPDELIGKNIEIKCYVPSKLCDSTSFDGSTGKQTTISMNIYEFVTFESTISGILSDSYTLQRESDSRNLVAAFLNYNQFIDIVNQNKNMDIGEKNQGFPERELGPSALVVFANTYADVSAVTSKIQNISPLFRMGFYLSDTGNIQENLFNVKSLLTTVTVVFIGIISILFSLLYYLKNRPRKREWGILKAIGFTKSNIVALTSIEMLRMAIPALFIAVVLSVILMLWINSVSSYDFISIKLSSIIVGFLVCVIVAVIAGMLPVRNALKVDPIDAIRKTHK